MEVVLKGEGAADSDGADFHYKFSFVIASKSCMTGIAHKIWHIQIAIQQNDCGSSHTKTFEKYSCRASNLA